MTKKKKILVILTGGTIGCAEENGVRRVVPATGARPHDVLLLRDFLSRHPAYLPGEFEVFEPLRTLSENMTVMRLQTLIEYLKTVDFNAYRGIILTHGTDTLAYTAAFIALVTKGIKIPIVLVSANAPLNNAQSNGHKNFAAAVQFIDLRRYFGTFVCYSYDDASVRFYTGEQVWQMDAVTERFGSFPGGQDGDDFGELRRLSREFIPFNSALCGQKETARFCPSEPLLYRLCDLEGGVLVIHPYPGLDYAQYNLDGVTTVLHTTYHSGTYCSDGEERSSLSLGWFKNRCAEKKIRLVLYAPHPSSIYESHIEGLPQITRASLETAYARILTANSLDLGADTWEKLVLTGC